MMAVTKAIEEIFELYLPKARKVIACLLGELERFLASSKNLIKCGINMRVSKVVSIKV